MKHSRLGRMLFALLAGVAASSSVAAQDNPDRRLNIVFIEADDLTQKWVGAFGAEHVRTPAIDRLADEGARFPLAVAQGTMCAPSRNSLITGLYPRNLGFYANGTLRQLPDGIWAFPQALQDAGYYTSYIGKSHIRPPLEGVERRADYRQNVALARNLGFDEADSYAGRVVVLRGARRAQDGWQFGQDIYADHLYERGLIPQFVEDAGGISTLPEDDYLDGHVRSDAVQWIEDYEGEDPFFLWVNFSAPHGPYDAPGDWIGSYSAEETPPVIRDDDKSDIPELLLSHPWNRSEDRLQRQRAEYAGMISYMDSQVARVVAALEARGMRENTMIVFFSDQGVMEGDHGLQHKYTLYDEVILPSLVIAMPGLEGGAVFSQPTELLDLVPTVLDVARVPARDRGPAKGFSLFPLLTGSGSFARTEAYSEIYDAVAMVTPDWKFIESSQGNVLFDRRNDPQELRNAIGDHPQVARELAARMEAWRAGQGGEAVPLTERGRARLLDNSDE